MYTSLHTHIYIYWSNYLYHLPVAFFCCFGQNAGFEVKRRKNKPSNIFPIFRAWRKSTITLLRVIPTMAFQSITYAISYDILLSGICIYLAYLLTFFLAFYLVYFRKFFVVDEHSDPELTAEVRRGTLWSGACGGELAVEVLRRKEGEEAGQLT